MLERRIEMKAGRELDALVAEKVIGLTDFYWLSGELHHEARYKQLLVPHYSTNISDAWQVVEKLDHNVTLEKFNTFTLDFNNAKQIEKYEYRATAWCDGHRGISYEEETAPLVICLSALKAKGVDIDGMDE
jgi:hypothetical protein